MDDNNSGMIEERRETSASNLDLLSAEVKLKFGWGRFRPQCLQFLNGPRSFLFVIIIYTILQATIVLGLTNITLTSIEKRFSITAKEMGLIAAANDISALVFVLFISYYADYGNKMKWVGGGGLLLGCGSLLYASPHFITASYVPGSGGPQAGICRTFNTNTTLPQVGSPTPPSRCTIQTDSDWYYVVILFLGQLIIGAGVAPFYSLAPPYLDDNVHPKMLPVYLGLSIAATFLAPAIGLVIGAKFLTIYVDLKKPKNLNLNVRDPRWIGAWWLGFLIFGILSIIWSIIILGFPRELPGARQRRDEHIRQGDLRKPNSIRQPRLKTILPELKSLLANPTFIFNTFGATCTSLYLGSIVPFVPKILQLKFGITPENTGYALAAITTPFMLIGTTIGLFIIKRFPLRDVCKKSALVIFIFRAIGSIGPVSFMIPGCKNIVLAGLTSQRNQSGSLLPPFHKIPKTPLMESCNVKCRCPVLRFFPVCGSDNKTYFDACHAGCTTRLPDKTFRNCSCVSSPQQHVSKGGSAKLGFCDRDCKNFLWFSSVFALVQVIQFINVVPEKTVTLRCVPDNKRAFANGVQYIFTKALGFLPGPILMGHAIDSSCLLWQNICGKKGRCFVYDNYNVSVVISIMGIAITGVSLIFYFLSWFWYQPDADLPDGCGKAVTNKGHSLETFNNNT